MRVLLLAGGWEGHDPMGMADFAEEHLLQGCRVERTDDLAILNTGALADFDLIVPVWTFGEIDSRQERALLDAVEGGTGVVAWHGATSAFLASRPHKHLLGGQFVAHPGADRTSYSVRFKRNDPLVEGLADFDLTSEQYYMLMDPAVKVLGTTVIQGDGMEWLAGVEMPAFWVRSWGQGRVAYTTIGHTVGDLAIPSVANFLQRAVRWAARSEEPTREAALR